VSAQGAAPQARITFEIPTPCENSFAWRRKFLESIRSAIGQAHINGVIDARIAVESCRALPPPIPQAESDRSR
jgi:hypothetical protein